MIQVRLPDAVGTRTIGYAGTSDTVYLSSYSSIVRCWWIIPFLRSHMTKLLLFFSDVRKQYTYLANWT